MAAFLLLVLLASTVSGLYIRNPRAAAGGGSGGGSGSMSGSGAGAFSSSSSFSSSSGTKVAPDAGGYGNFNAFSGMSNFPSPDAQSVYRGGSGSSYGSHMGQPSFSGAQEAPGFPGPQAGGFSGSSSGFSGSSSGFPGFQGAGFPGFPGHTPFVPQYGQQYPWVPFPNFAAPFDFMAFLNQYFQALQNFQAQAQAQAEQAAASNGGGLPIETNEVGGAGGLGGVGGLATATYGPQGGYGNANVFPKPEGGLDNRFGGDDEAPQNSIGGGPVSSVSGSFKPPQGSSYGVFTSSSSGSSDINGKKTSFKQSSVGVNDNGKITTYTSHDP